MKPTILIVDDDEEIRTQMKWALADEYEILLAGDRAGALERSLSGKPAVTLLDLGLPPSPNDSVEGMEILAGLLDRDPMAKVIIISGQEEKENAVRAVGAGACDFLCKPVRMEELRLLIERCVYVSELEREYREMRRRHGEETFEDMVGQSPRMQIVFAMILKVAKSDAPVLILGESGTGKEMAARAIHRHGTRRNGEFVAINCSAIPPNLLESELFGHEKGAFTGAHARRSGLIEAAAGGTLFLDEIGDLQPAMQVKLLRFLQEQCFQRVGGREPIKIDTRVVAATNVDLKQAIEKGAFREDLYFRLAVVTLTLPALRERGDDIDLLTQRFLQRLGEENGKEGLSFAPDTLRAIRRHAWPGNIRELQNRVERAVIMAEGRRITVEDMELQSVAEVHPPRTLREARETIEREMVEKALRKNEGKISLAAADLGISRPTFYELMQKLEISRDRPLP